MNWAIVIFAVCSCSLSAPSTAVEFEEKSSVELLGNNTTTTTSPLNQTNYGNSAENIDSTPDSTTEEEFTSESSTSEPLSSSSFTLKTFPPGPTVMPSSPSTTMPEPLVIKEAGNPPGWAIALISLMVVVSLILTGVIFVRKYCARKRKEERRYLLARSQESFFIGEQNNGFNEGL